MKSNERFYKALAIASIAVALLSIVGSASGAGLQGSWSGPASGLLSATTTVDVSASTAPVTGYVLKATDSTHATWQVESGGGGGSQNLDTTLGLGNDVGTHSIVTSSNRDLSLLPNGTGKVAVSGTGIKLPGSTSGAVSLKAPAVAGTQDYTFPANYGTNGYFLQTDAAGGLTWAAAGGGGGTSGNGTGLVAPDATGWTGVNLTGSDTYAFNVLNGRSELNITAVGCSAWIRRGLVQTIPSTPCAIEMAMMYPIHGIQGGSDAGFDWYCEPQVGFYDSVNHKFISVGVPSVSYTRSSINVDYWSVLSGGGAAQRVYNMPDTATLIPKLIYYRMEWDGTNYQGKVSYDGVSWQKLGAVVAGAGTVATPDSIGIFWSMYPTTDTTYSYYVNIPHIVWGTNLPGGNP